METAGFHGCVGSTEATHVGMERCSYRLAQIHRGGKLPMPSRTSNMTVNHRTQILSSTFGNSARWNDKSLQLYDSFVTGIQQGTKIDDVTFELVEADKDGNIVFVKYEGDWLIVDNGYLRWPTTVPPFKESAEYKEIRFLQWLESMRKDVECTFGMLKGRFAGTDL